MYILLLKIIYLFHLLIDEFSYRHSSLFNTDVTQAKMARKASNRKTLFDVARQQKEMDSEKSLTVPFTQGVL